MVELSAFLGALEQDDVEWMLSVGRQLRLAPGERIIEQGGRPEGLFVLLEGRLAVQLAGVEGTRAFVEAGELVGEISFLDSRPASAHVSAAVASSVLRIARADLERRIEERPRFGGRLYRALGMLLAERFRGELPRQAAPTPLERPAYSEMAGALHHVFTQFATRPAYQTDAGWITYGESGARVRRLAPALAALRGAHPVVGTLLPNSFQLLELYYAAALSGSVLFPANHRLAPQELAGIFRTSGAGVLVTSSAFAERLAQLDWEALPVHTIVWLDRICPVAPKARHLAWDNLLSGPAEAPLPAPTPDQHLQGFGTSGTTGEPKMILHTHASVLSHCLASMQALDLEATDQHCWGHFGPMFHVGDAAFVWIATLLGARHVFLANPLDFRQGVALLSEAEVTICKIVPSLLKLLVHSGVAEGRDFPKLRWILTGGAAPDRTLVRQTSELFDCDFIQGYGMTEATCHVAFKNETQSPSPRGLTVLPGLELAILDEEHRAVPGGTIGEIAIRGPNVFSAEIAEGKVVPPREGAFTAEGFYLSGDLGKLDKHGELHIAGRSKDMINVGGENVFAGEVEAIVYRLKGVQQCAAFAMPHPDLGEVVELAVVRGEAGLDAARIASWCRQLLASYKCPRRIHFLDALPLTPTGKIRKMILREQILAQGPAPAAAPEARPAATPAEPVGTVLRGALAAAGLGDFPRERSLFDGGLDSLGALDLIERLQARLGRPLPASLLYEHPTVAALEGYLETLDRAPPPERKVEAVPPPPAQAEAPIEGRPLPAPLRLPVQALGLLLRPLVYAAGVVPLLLLLDALSGPLGRWGLFLLAPLGIGAALLLSMLTALLLKWAILGRARPGRVALWSGRYHRWMMVNNLFRCLEYPLGALRGTALLNAFYRLCGARIGAGARLEAVDLQDLDLVTIGAGAWVGHDANLQPARLSDGALLLAPVTLGERCVVEPQASVLGDTAVPAGGRVRALDAAPDGGAPPLPPRPNALLRAAGYLLVAYAAAAALAAGILFTEWIAGRLPSLLRLAAGHGSEAGPRFFLGVALAVALVIPAAYFLLVVLLKRIGRAGPWLYARLIDVPFFPQFLRLWVMSQALGWVYRALGARVGRRPVLAAPYVAAPARLTLGDRALLAGNVSVFGEVTLEAGAIVANSCVLQDGARLGAGSLLGDLSRLGRGDPAPAGVIAVGRPPRVVGAADLAPDSVAPAAYARLQAALVALQTLLVVGGQVPGLLLFGLLVGWLAPAPLALILLLPALLLLARGVKLLLLPLAKWALLGRVRPGEHPAYGAVWVRWLALEALVMDLEQSLLLLRGTHVLPWLYRALGARVGRGACLFCSSLGSEYDLKTIGAGALLDHRALVFGHSVERRTLIFRPATVGAGAEVGSLAIVEAGAAVEAGARVAPHLAVHARRARAEAPLTLADFEAAARRRLTPAVFGYFAGGAGDERALARNAAAFDEVRFAPRVLVDVARVSTACHLLGRRLAAPILVAPTAMNRLVHDEGERAVAAAARQLGLGMVLSTLSNTPLEAIGAAFRGEAGDAADKADGGGDGGLALFQLYALKDRARTEALMHRAAAAGFAAIVLTVDAPVSGRRERDIRNRFQLAEGLPLPHLEGLARDAAASLLAFEQAKDPSLDWARLKDLAAASPLPLWLKGVLRAEDALSALDCGVSGLILSNHGGRQFDSAPAALDMLPAVRRALDTAGHSAPLLIDGGVRRGEHVFAALALGADAVLLGRPVVWGLADSGRAGVSRVLGLLQEELVTAMRLAGCASLAEIGAEGVVGR